MLSDIGKKSALDRINFTGDFRFEARSIEATVPTHFEGMALQGLMVNTFFSYGVRPAKQALGYDADPPMALLGK